MEGLIFLIIIFWVIPALVRGSKKKGNQSQAQGQSTTAARQNPTIPLHRPAPVASHAGHRDFSAPEAPCIVCENTGDDHFQRDKARRLSQLDDWLKIGLIDRDEYRVLKDRYQRGI